MRNSEEEDIGGDYLAPWEQKFDRLLTPFEEFLHRQTTGSLLLVCMTVVALFLANGPLAAIYSQVIHINFGVILGDWSLIMNLHHWVNDGLMAIFFFVVGLELKREFLVGELAKIRNAILPIAAAIGGMVIPALVYYAVNPSGVAAVGWGIPMATDIAFAIGALALLNNRVPRTLITFLVALAIVDDLGAVMVIALFYTDTISLGPLAIALALFGVLIVFNLAGVRSSLPYFLIAVILWYALYKSGVHATLAGILGALTVPAIPKYNPENFSERVQNLMHKFDMSRKPGKSIMTNIEMRAVVQSLEIGVKKVQTPLQRLEHIWHMPVAYLVIPVFALFNAGIQLDFGSLGETLVHPVVVGVSSGLILGKFIGITGASWLVLKMGLADLPKGTSFSQIAGVSFLAGIGFTMSIFVAQLGFGEHGDLLLKAKTGILFASLVSGAIGVVWLYLASNKPEMELAQEHE
jgi:NhaA family Na+:H+ antiporter